MASRHRKPLYADLFKPPPKPRVEIPPSWTSTSTSASSWTHSLPSCDSSSSSSGFTTPPCSELASSLSEDDVDFIGELTRQMAEECMVQEEDDQLEARELDRNCRNDVNGSKSCGMPSVQVYEMKNQPPEKKLGRKRRVKASDSGSAQSQSQPQPVNGYFPGSGMQAVYLGGSRSVGTGVFLPRLNSEPEPEPVRVKKKSGKKTGCPIVLVPTRVLQLLQHHFNQVEDSNHPYPYPNDESMVGIGSSSPWSSSNTIQQQQAAAEEEGDDEDGSIGIEDDDGIELPKEWTYTPFD